MSIDHPTPLSPDFLSTLDQIQKRILWLATNMIHHANHVRPNPDGSKVGGHQASSASMVTMMTALYFHHLRYGDRVAVKPHASPVFHAIQYLMGQLERDYLPKLRAYGGLQAYPSRTKDPDQVDFSTGSVGLGPTATAFAALADQYAQSHFGTNISRRFVALVGDAELDEGNIWEALLDEPIRSLGNLLWIVDLNRQSLDRVIPGIKAARLKRLFADCGWQVLEAKYGRRLQSLFDQPNGDALQERIDQMPNEAYQAMIRLSGTEIRQQLPLVDGKLDDRIVKLIANVSDEELPTILQNLGGHDFTELISRFAEADGERKRPSIIFAYTIKGWDLPIMAHPLNHSMLMNQAQVDDLRQKLGVGEDEWAAFAPNSAAGELCAATAKRLYPAQSAPTSSLLADELPSSVKIATQGKLSTQQSFGRILMALSREKKLFQHLVTASPDVSTSTNLSGWISKTAVYSHKSHPESANANWTQNPQGQHIELGISEMNLFMLLGMFGLSAELIDQPLIPIGTVYDPFVCRGLDSFIYALYSGSKFIVAGTPSGISLSPEGGAHQSAVTPSLGIELPNLNYFEPCYAQELAWMMLDAVRDCCDRVNGKASYLRLSTKPIEQRPFHNALARLGEEKLRQQVLAGGYRLLDWREEREALHKEYLVHIISTGAMIPEALAAAHVLHEEGIPANVINLTSPRRLFEAWQQMSWGNGATSFTSGEAPFEWLIPMNERHAPIIILNDGASHAHAWLGSVFGSVVMPLGVDQFGQSGARDDLYHHFGIGTDHIVDAALTALNRMGLR